MGTRALLGEWPSRPRGNSGCQAAGTRRPACGGWPCHPESVDAGLGHADTPGSPLNLRPCRLVDVDPLAQTLGLGPLLDLPGHQDFAIRRRPRRTLHPGYEVVNLCGERRILLETRAV